MSGNKQLLGKVGLDKSFVVFVFIVGLFLASVLYLYQQHQISELTKELERLRKENGDLQKIIRELEEEVFHAKFADEGLELEYPTVCVSNVDYKEADIDVYSNPNFSLAWDKFGNKTNVWCLKNLGRLIEYVGDKAEELGLDSTEITQILVNLSTSRMYKIWISDGGSAKVYSILLVPCYVEKARYGDAEIWLIVFNRGDILSTWLRHYDTYVVECGTQKILDQTGCM